MLDTRRHLYTFIYKNFRYPLKNALIKFILSFILSYLLAYIPEYGLEKHALEMLFILFFASMLWITEAIPAFSVSLLLIGLEIILLGFPDFNFDSSVKDWQYYLNPWSSPLVFLFLAGFIMALAASKTKLDLWMAKFVLFYVGNKPANVLMGLILITFVLSMFISNTATTAMMLTVLTPILASMKEDNSFQKAILLGVVVAANIGGMGTIIGTPPNAIAVGALGEEAPSFLGWMIHALPPAIVIMAIMTFVILKLYPSNEDSINVENIKMVSHFDDSTSTFSAIPTMPSWKKILVVFTFAVTVLLWLTGPIHHIPTTVVSFFPIIILTIFGIIDVEDIQKIRWDVIILIIGGLSLGAGISKTGLDDWISQIFDLKDIGILLVVVAFAYGIVIISNFMSNTAATNILLPIVIAVSSAFGEHLSAFAVITVALCASFAMTLPVSTPPNAIMYSSGKLESKDFIKIGITVGIFAPTVAIAWLKILY